MGGEKTYFFFTRDRGLCSVFRSRAGDLDTLRRVLSSGNGRLVQDDESDPVLPDAGRFVSTDPHRHNHNVHWLEDELGVGCEAPSRYVAYYDAASLYPSSGESTFSPVGASFARVEGRERSLDLGQAR